MKADGLRILGWAIPILCMAAAGWIFYKENQEFHEADLAKNQAQRENEVAAREYQQLNEQPPGRRYASVDDVPEEEIAFLTFLRTRCAANKVNFKNWFSITTEYGKDKSSTPKDEKTAALLKGIRKISASLVLVGPYDNLRKLIGEVETSDRLYTLSNLNWLTVKEGTQLSLTVSRYVSPGKPSLKKPAPKPDAKAANAPAASGHTPGLVESSTRQLIDRSNPANMPLPKSGAGPGDNH
jgi:hypothetical protein